MEENSYTGECQYISWNQPQKLFRMEFFFWRIAYDCIYKKSEHIIIEF